LKNNICFAILFCLMVVISPIQGCGGSEDESKKAASEPDQTQMAVEDNKGQPAGNHGTSSRNTEPADIAEMQPAAPEVKKNQPAESNAAVSQKTELINDVDTKTPVLEIKTGQPSESNAAVSQKTQSSDAADTQPAAQEVTEVITIENQGYISDKKGPVKFNHLKHNKDYKVSCTQCHHLYKDGENQWKEGDHVDRCIVCHNPAEEKDKAIKLQNAFHKNCRDCHSEAFKEGKAAPSTKCSDCHG
jgi:hypothetical protein